MYIVSRMVVVLVAAAVAAACTSGARDDAPAGIEDGAPGAVAPLGDGGALVVAEEVVRGAVTAAPPDAPDALHDEMLATAVEQGLITAEEAETFRRVHDVLDEDRPMAEAAMHAEGGPGPDAMASMQRARTAAAVADGRLSQADADAFTRIHDLLVERGLMAP